MNSSEMMDITNEIERLFPVERWTMTGVHLWPIIRIDLNFGLIHSYYNREQQPSRFIRRAGQALEVLSGMGNFLSASIRDRDHNSKTAKSDAIFLVDGMAYTRINGLWYDHLCEPIREFLAKEGFSSLFLTPQGEYRIPRHAPSIFIEPRLDLQKIRHVLFPAATGQKETFLEGFKDFQEYLQKRRLPISIPSEKNICNRILLALRLADFYQSMLERIQPTVAFVVNYYRIEGMSFNLACRRRNIPSIDIQHGLQGPLHVAYGRWNKVPRQGYELLPSLFWCWSEWEASAISVWSSSIAPYHRPIVGGNLWMEQWKDGTTELVSTTDDVVNRIKEAHAGSIHIMVTLQFSLADPETLAPLLQAIKNGDRVWFWWMRLHPCMLNDCEIIRRLMRNNGICNVEIDAATNLPLYGLLRHMDLHITHSSSTVIEAEFFDVPSIIFSSYGAEFFPDQLASGVAVQANTSDAILSAIPRQLVKRKEMKIARVGRPRSNGIEEIIDLIRQRGVSATTR